MPRFIIKPEEALARLAFNLMYHMHFTWGDIMVMPMSAVVLTHDLLVEQKMKEEKEARRKH